MKFSDGVKAVKEERRNLVKRLRQIDSILAGFAGLVMRNGAKAKVKSRTVKAKKVRKPRAGKIAEKIEGPNAFGD